jgi:hypothetical protein
VNGQDLFNYLHDLRKSLKPNESLSDLVVGVVGDVEEGTGATLLNIRRISSGKGYIAIDCGLQSPPQPKEDKPKIVTPGGEIAAHMHKQHTKEEMNKAEQETKKFLNKLNDIVA